MKKMRIIAASLLILAVGFGLGLLVHRETEPEPAVVLNGFGSENIEMLLGEPEKPTITIEEVKQKLAEMDQLAAYTGTYTVEKTMDFSRYIFDNIRIPGAINTVSLLCEGVVKVGYDVAGIEPAIDNTNQIIRINLPEAEILDHYVIWGNVDDLEENKHLSPIAFPEYQEMMLEAEGDILAQAETECIYEKAEDNIQSVIRNYLSGFDGYKVVFA